MIRPLFAALVLAALAACAPSPRSGPAGMSPKGEVRGYARANAEVAPSAVPGAPSDAAAQAFAVDFLNSIQALSIAQRSEYCGYFYVDEAGQIRATPPRRGSFASCDMPAPRRGEGIFASYHTHGAYGANYDNEVPSVTDLESDFAFAVDGYVSTPGGRVWHVDNGTRSTRQICGPGCVYVDPGFRPVGEAGIRASYNLSQLGRRAAGY